MARPGSCCELPIDITDDDTDTGSLSAGQTSRSPIIKPEPESKKRVLAQNHDFTVVGGSTKEPSANTFLTTNDHDGGHSSPHKNRPGCPNAQAETPNQDRLAKEAVADSSCSVHDCPKASPEQVADHKDGNAVVQTAADGDKVELLPLDEPKSGNGHQADFGQISAFETENASSISPDDTLHDQDRDIRPPIPDLTTTFLKTQGGLFQADDDVPMDDGEALAMYADNYTNIEPEASIFEQDLPCGNGNEEFYSHEDNMDWISGGASSADVDGQAFSPEFLVQKEVFDKKVLTGTDTMEDRIFFLKAEKEENLRIAFANQKGSKGDEDEDEDKDEDENENEEPASNSQGQDKGDCTMIEVSPASICAEENPMFFPDETASESEQVIPVPASKPAKALSKKKGVVSAKAQREAMEVGREVVLANPKKAPRAPRQTPGASLKKGVPSTGARPRGAAQGRGSSRGRRGRRPILSNIQSLGQCNIVAEAKANESKPDAPTFTSKNKADALAELVASIPTTDHQAKGDSRALLEASKKFGHSAVKVDGRGGWILRGMESSLFNHQLLGSAWMRQRELDGKLPFGGMVCDEMGFGKTIQMIANMIGGKPQEGDPRRTTLIIAPSSLLNQWMSEIIKHSAKKKDGSSAFGKILMYRSGSRINSNNPVADLMGYDVVLTTYAEVRKSYPVTKAPLHITSVEGRNKWWEDFYKENAGTLHRIPFHRIVLDEAHTIKNHTSKTSIAIRALAGHFRWIMTGTPILNYIEELFPYFSFLKVPHTGDYPTFLHNFCNNRTTRAPVKMDRIHNILRAIMLRRTHADTICGVPIIKLPGLEVTTIEVDFSPIETAIYKTVKQCYVEAINMISRAGQLNANYHNILGMLSRLRMIASHAYLVQTVLNDIFGPDNFEKQWRFLLDEVEKVQQTTHVASGHMTLEILRERLLSNNATGETAITQEAGAVTGNGSTAPGGDSSLYHRFRKFLRELFEAQAWAELNLRSVCAKCRSAPEDPMCTSCYHVYCEECVSSIEYDMRLKKEDSWACLGCSATVEERAPCGNLKEIGLSAKKGAAPADDPRYKRGGATKSRAKRVIDSATRADDGGDGECWIDMPGAVPASAKTAATKAQILEWVKSDPTEKIIIYTQFLGLCRILGKMCAAEKWNHVMFTGSMSVEQREYAMQRFRTDPEVKIMICSLKAGGVGLNLTMASKVIILDLWFNSCIEAQAYCRAFRIGQKRKVEVVRFVVRGTIDEDLVAMQERKDKEVNCAISPEHLGKRATVTQLLQLFGEVVEEGENEFVLVEDGDNHDEAGETLDNVPPPPF